jgi:integrase
MSRPSKGARLYLATGRVHPRTGKPIADVYYIRDGALRISTGCGPDRVAEAEAALGRHIADKHTRAVTDGPTDETDRTRRADPTRVFIAEVVAYYAEHRGPEIADPVSLAGRLSAVTDWWEGKTLDDIKRSNCLAYVAARQQMPVRSYTKTAPRLVSAQAARRELEDLSAAIGFWDDEHHLIRRPKVTLPPKPESQRDALTRSQAAALLLGAMGWRKGEDGRWRRLPGSSVANRAHLRRFVLIGLYTGTRPGVMPKLLWEESPTQAWIDLEDETIYRRGKAEKDQRTKRRPLVKIPPRLLAHLKRWRCMDNELMARREAAGLKTTNSVLHHGGRPIAGRIRRSFSAAVADAGLADGITPHWQRHTAATLLMEGGAKLWDAAGYLGMSPTMLEKNYGHHRPDHQAGAKNAAGGRRTA